MARTKLPIDKIKLQTIINELENIENFTNRQQLAEAVEKTEWAENHEPKPVTSSVVILRIKEFDLTVKTPIGKRGKQKVVLDEKTVSSRSKKKILKTKDKKLRLKQLCKGLPKRYYSLANKIVGGCIESSVELNCLKCCNYDVQEIIYCSITECVWNSVRPYQKHQKKE